MIKKSYKSNIPDKDVSEKGTVIFCSWEKLLPYLEEEAGLSPFDDKYIVAGIITDENGIKIILERT